MHQNDEHAELLEFCLPDKLVTRALIRKQVIDYFLCFTSCYKHQHRVFI